MSEGLGMLACAIEETAGLQAIPFRLKVHGDAVVILRRGVLADDVCEESHFTVLLGQLKGLVHALGQDEELNGRIKIS